MIEMFLFDLMVFFVGGFAGAVLMLFWVSYDPEEHEERMRRAYAERLAKKQRV